MKLQKILCKLHIHKKQKCSAPFILLGKEGRLETWVCKCCNYKSKNGRFIPEKK